MMNKITVSKVAKKDLKLVGYLVSSGVLGWALATYVAGNEMLTIIFAPAINYVIYRILQEMENQGYRKALNGKRK